MKHTVRPYQWVPSLYLGEALPYAAVMLISVVFYQEMGLSDTQITLYTGWLGLPWVVKPLWSPIVDSIRTKRWWIWVMQMLMGVSLACVAFTIPTAFWLQASLALFMLIAFQSATHDICADGFYILGLESKDQDLYVGVRNTFYRIGMVLGQGGLVMLVGALQNGFCSLPATSVAVSYAIVFLLLALLLAGLGLYHRHTLPRVEQESRETASPRQVVREFGRTWKLFFQKPHIATALLFILLFRLPEGLLTKMVPLFLKRTTAEGGLGLDDFDYGVIYGTIGVIGLLAGGLLGGWLVSRYGLKRCLWPLVLCITLPDVVYVYLSHFQPQNLWVTGAGVCIEQVGYGLGFTAYTLYLVSFARGEHSTAIFSLCTAFQYLGGVMLPGIVSGWIGDRLGSYNAFFWLVMALCSVTFAVTAMVKIPENEAPTCKKRP